MRRHNELFAKVFERAAERNIAGSKRAKAAATHLRKCFGKAEMDDDDPMEAICDLLAELAAEQCDDADFALECCKTFMKADSDELGKMSAINPQSIFRTGQRDLTTAVDPQFAKLVAVDEDDSNMRNPHL